MPGNLLRRIPKKPGMIHCDGGNHRQKPVFRHIHGIQVSAHAAFQHCQTTALLCKQGKGSSRFQFKAGRVDPIPGKGFRTLPHQRACLCKLLRRTAGGAQLILFQQLKHRRRGIRPGGTTSCLQHGGQHGAHGAFSVGTCHHNGLQPLLGIPHPGKQRLHGVQSWSDAPIPLSVKPLH